MVMMMIAYFQSIKYMSTKCDWTLINKKNNCDEYKSMAARFDLIIRIMKLDIANV